MAYGIQISAIAGLAIGVCFIVLFAVAVPGIPVPPTSTFESSDEARKYMPASYYLNACNLPPAGMVSLESTQDNNVTSITSNTTSPPSTIREIIKDRTWISVVKVNRTLGLGTGIESPCTILTSDLASKVPALATAIRGADGCINGSEVCRAASGLSRGGDEADYELTITKEEATDILKEVKLGLYNTAMLAYGDKFYMMWFHSYGIDEVLSDGAHVEVRFLEPPSFYTPIPLASGESINYTLLVKTWATFGGPAKIDMISSASAKDSGLLVELVPATLEMEERTEAIVDLRITATKDVRNGTYEVNIGGKINDYGYITSGPCDFSCIGIQIGNSKWKIQTFGNDTQIGQYRRGTIPDWLYLEIQTDKETYAIGEPVEIAAYLVNDGTERFLIDDAQANMRLITMMGGPSASNYASVYGIDAHDVDSQESVIVEAKSKTLLVRSFVWDQKTFRSDSKPEQVAAGDYQVSVSFAGPANGVLIGNHVFTISATSNR